MGGIVVLDLGHVGEAGNSKQVSRQICADRQRCQRCETVVVDINQGQKQSRHRKSECGPREPTHAPSVQKIHHRRDDQNSATHQQQCENDRYSGEGEIQCRRSDNDCCSQTRENHERGGPASRILPPPLIRDDQGQEERHRNHDTRQQTITGNSFVETRPKAVGNDFDQKAVWSIEREVAQCEPPDSQFEAAMRRRFFHDFYGL